MSQMEMETAICVYSHLIKIPFIEAQLGWIRAGFS